MAPPKGMHYRDVCTRGHDNSLGVPEQRRKDGACNQCVTDDRRARSKAYQAAYYATRREALRGRRRAYYAENRQMYRDYYREHLYGLDPGGYLDMYALQNGVCLICGDPPKPDKELHVDHDHRCCPGMKSCGKCVRGLLCNSCNLGLGKFKDNPEMLRVAASYIEGALVA